MRNLFFIKLIILILASCSPSNKNNHEGEKKHERVGLSAENLSNTIVCQKKQPVLAKNDSSFIQLVSDTLLVNLGELGFYAGYDSIFMKISIYGNHWFLKTLIAFSEGNLFLSKEKYKHLLLDKEDFEKIKTIHQAVFYANPKYPSNHDLVIEEWVFENVVDARYWLGILESAKGNYFSKPPRQQWQQNNKIVVVNMRAAMFWWDFKDKVIMLLKDTTDI